ncbi:hypothetical protein ACHAXT_007593 [Thalassiosira profunda]
MNRLLLLSASKIPAAASSLRGSYSGASAAARLSAARRFSGASGALTKGEVLSFDARNKFGFIVPDGVDKTDHENKDLFFVHRNDIKAVKSDGDRESAFFPKLRRGQRVEFRAGPPNEGTEAGKAYDVTLEGGKLVAPFEQGDLKRYIRSQKSRFGDRVFEIYSTTQDQKELERKIVEAYDMARERIEQQTATMTRVAKAAGIELELEDGAKHGSRGYDH